MKNQNLERAAKYLDSWFDLNFPFSHTPGLVVMVQHGDQIIFQKALGMANVEEGIPMREDHLFRIASHSKMFTAVALMQLVEKGALRLDEPLVTYLPWLHEAKDKRYLTITTRHVLEHAAGITRDGNDANYWQLQRPFPNKEELIQDLKSTRLVFEPNERFKYSNYGFSLLGLLIEQISSTTYSEYIQEHIFKPLDMNTASADLSADQKNLAIGYSREDKSLKRAPLTNPQTNAMASATGICASAEDLCKFARIFYKKNSVLSDMGRREIMRMHWNVDEGEFNELYGFGCERVKIGSHYYIGHAGGFPGFITNTLIDPKKELTFVVLRNSLSGASVSHALIHLVRFFMDLKITTSSKALNEYVGRYENPWTVLDIINRGDKLISFSPLDWGTPRHPDELKKIKRDEFVIEKTSGYESLGEPTTFTRSLDGKIISVSYGGYEAPRIEDL